MNRSILKNLTLFQTILNKQNNVTCSANLIRFCSNDTLLKDPEQKEVKIPVPWGHIAGKQWGNPDGKKVLCLHGWLDNSGSFDNLAPLLPNDKFNFLAIDLLGHGFSSHYPPGMLYRFADSFMVIRYVKEHMKWDNFSFLSHSLGGIISTWYAAIFPEEVNRVISLDIVSVSPTKLNKQVQTTRKAVLSGIETFDKLSGNHEVPTYSYIDAVARAFMANQFHGVEYPITQEAVETLMKRGLRKVDEDKYTWTADLRLRIPATFNPLEEQVEQYSSNVKCPMMIIKASGSHYYMKEEMAKRIINVYKNHNPNFEIHNVIGGHHIHMTDPEKVIGLINDFLLKTDFVPPDEELLKRDNIPMDLF